MAIRNVLAVAESRCGNEAECTGKAIFFEEMTIEEEQALSGGSQKGDSQKGGFARDARRLDIMSRLLRTSLSKLGSASSKAASKP